MNKHYLYGTNRFTMSSFILLEINFTPYIPTSLLGLLGLLFGYLYYYFRNKNDNKLQTIQSASENDRIKAIEMYLNELGTPINTDNLEPKEKYDLLAKSLAVKTKRYLITAITLISISGLITLLIANHNGNNETIQDKDNKVLSLELIDRTAKIHDWLSKGSKKETDTIQNNIVKTVWSKPNEFSIQQIIELSEINPKKVLTSLVALLSDRNVTVSSGALVAISRILAHTDNDLKKKDLLSLIPDAANMKAKTNLLGASLQKQDLRPLNKTDIFYGADIRFANFSKSKLDSITFKTANSKYTNFYYASLDNVIFDMVEFEGVNFSGANASNASFIMSFFRMCNLGTNETENYRDNSLRITSSSRPANFEDANFDNAQFYDTDFSEARIGGAKFNGTIFSNVNLTGAYLKGMSPEVTKEYMYSSGVAVINDCVF